MITPQFTHDSTCCQFLGRSTDGTHDLYTCNEVGRRLYSARYGNDGPEYQCHDATTLLVLEARYPDAARYLVEARAIFAAIEAAADLQNAAITDFGAQTVAEFIRLEHESLTFADVVAIYADDAALWDALYDFREQRIADSGALGVGA